MRTYKEKEGEFCVILAHYIELQKSLAVIVQLS